MKMMNFRRFDPNFLAEGKVGLTRGNKEEETIWAEFGADPAALAAEVIRVRQSLNQETLPMAAAPIPGRAALLGFRLQPKKMGHRPLP
ncbi:hypothetical protein ASG52_22670 [Methylobacterium sp. Leaf456]|uniref:hypothetical protein n=1 Tax=Methylobacterium sp. Leaf456 TaxID=1736382 RepID=UPI0006F97844|nr:hypothetical protein [Methylobacterium sp. Leaf456]KQT58254.1 hypothetical protein ASG52_22670 [Methylobacterium sp. Leaf456]